METQKELELLLVRAAQCVQRGFVGGTSGNVSLRLGDRIFISPTGERLDELTAEGMTVLNAADGTVLSGPAPSQEWRMHWEIYQTRPEVRAVFHLHPLDCIAASILLWPERELPLYAPAHGIKLGRVRLVGLYRAGSEALAQSTAAEFARQDVNAVLLHRHGCIVAAPTVNAAYGKTEYLIEACRLHTLLRGAGAMSPDAFQQYRVQPLTGPAPAAEKEE